MELLGDIIKKYEKGGKFYLRIQLLDNDEEMVDAHAVTIANVCIWVKYSN